MPSSLTYVFSPFGFGLFFFTSTYFTCFITGCITQLDGKRRQKGIYSKEIEINYINFVTEDADEKEGVLAVGWETEELFGWLFLLNLSAVKQQQCLR